MQKNINILIIEDLPSDAELSKREINKILKNCSFRIVETEEDFINALDDFQPEIIVSDYSLPNFDGLTALNLTLDKSPLTPFIILTGSMNEETAVNCMKAGATDYVIKEHIKRLGTAILSALEKKEIIQKKLNAEIKLKESEVHFRTLADTGLALIWTSGLDKKFNYFNRILLEFVGKNSNKEFGNEWIKGIHPEDLISCLQIYNKSFDTRQKFSMDFRLKHFSGEYRWMQNDASPRYDSYGKFIGYIGHCLDITDRKNMIEELVLAKEKAEQSEKLKSEFLAQMSHEIRSPMNVIISYANLLKSILEETLSPELKEYFDGIDSAGLRLIRTVDLILNTAEMNVGSYEATVTKFDIIKNVILKVIGDYESLIKQKGLTFNYVSNISEAIISGDNYSIYQIFTNLIDNSLKYTNQGSISVIVDNKDGNKNIAISIEDTGIGISEEFMENIFEPFMQEEMGYSRRYEGNGLGLALVKNYCNLNRASISVESKKGVGSKFTVTFPILKN
ncbi:MAG: ATP-binding protein [Melioribacteraceae bacterium]